MTSIFFQFFFLCNFTLTRGFYLLCNSLITVFTPTYMHACLGNGVTLQFVRYRIVTNTRQNNRRTYLRDVRGIWNWTRHQIFIAAFRFKVEINKMESLKLSNQNVTPSVIEFWGAASSVEISIFLVSTVSL